MNSQLFTPDYSHITGLLKQLNDEELKELLNNEEKLKTIVNDLKQVHDIEAEREMLIASNKSISEYNLSKKPDLELHRKQVEETRQIAIELKDSFLEKKRLIEQGEKAVAKDTLLALLQAATSEVEEKAEASVEFFLNNELSVDDFLPEYLELRKLAHLRRIKAEKLANIIQGDQGQILATPYAPPRLRKPPTPPTQQSNLPYPPQSQNVPTQNHGNYGPVRTAPHPPINNYPTHAYGQNQNPAMPYGPNQNPANPYGQNQNPSMPYGPNQNPSMPYGQNQNPSMPYGYKSPPYTGYYMPRPQQYSPYK